MNKIIFAFVAIVLLSATTAASTHKHSKHTSKERLQDGVYSPRDAKHNEVDEHHVEFDHEAIIGSVKEAGEFDQLSHEEAKDRLEVIIKQMDYNQDYFIDRHELKSWILRSFKKLAEEEANDRFTEIDENDDGQITWHEYFLNVYGQNNDQELDSSEEKIMIEEDKVMFDGADLDKDGILTVDEYVLFQNPEESPQMLPIVLNQTMNAKDKNDDGQIDFKEYIGDSAESNDKEWLLTEKTKFDDDFDKNKDGVLTGNEVLSWIVPSNDEIAGEEVDHLFASTDTDHDNRLSYKEILDNVETWVGSEVTDYGELLHSLVHFGDEL